MDPIERQLDHMRRVALPEKLRQLVGIGDAVTFSLNLEPLEIYILPLNTPIPHSKLTKRIDGLGRVAIPKQVCLIGNLGEYDTVTLRAADDNSHIILTQKEIDYRRNAAEWLAAALYYFLKTPIIVAAEYGTIGYCGPIECKVQCYMRDYFMAVKEWSARASGYRWR